MSNEIKKRKENILKALGLKFYEPFTINDKKYILRITEDFFIEELHKLGGTDSWGKSPFCFREIIDTKITPIIEYTDVEKTIIKCAYLAGYKYVIYIGEYSFVFCENKDIKSYKNDPYIIIEFPNINLDYDIPHLKFGAVEKVNFCKGEEMNEIN